jgi:hypothetical protein
MRDLEKRLEHLRDLGGLANLNDYVEARRQYSLHNIAPPHNVKTCRVCQLAKEVL